MSYFSYEVTSTIRTVNNFQIAYPKIVICLSNMFSSPYAIDYALAYFRARSGINYTSLAEVAETYDPAAIQNEVQFLRSKLNSNKVNDSVRQSLGYKANDMIVDCNFRLKKCDFDTIRWQYESVLGNCYSFNSGFAQNGSKVPLYTATDRGYPYGLQLTVFSGFNNLNTVNSSAFVDSFGVKILVLNQSMPSSSRQILNAPIGLATYIGMKKVTSKSIPSPYSTCENVDNHDSDLYRLATSNNLTYNQQYCLDLCKQKILYDNCRCENQDLPSLNNPSIRFCSSVDKIDEECVQQQIAEYSFGSLEKNCLRSGNYLT